VQQAKKAISRKDAEKNKAKKLKKFVMLFFAALRLCARKAFSPKQT
jgi:hypothetical protein